MKGLICECRNAIHLTVTVGVSAIFAGADVAAWSAAPNAMRKVLDIKNVSNTSYGTIGKTRPVVALRTRASALAGAIAEYIKAIGLSRKTNWLGNSVSGTGNTIRQRTLSMRSVNAPQILRKQYPDLRELLQPVFQRLSSQLYMASLVWGSASMLRGGSTKKCQYTLEHPEYVPLSAALMGSFIGGLLEGFCVFLLILGAGAVVSALGLSALSLSLYQATKTVLISYLIFPLVRALVQRPLVVRAQRPSPGGVLFAAYEFLIPPPVYLVVALAVTQDIGKAVMVGVCALVFYLAYVARFKPWKPGFTRTEVRSKIEQTKQMTREMFGEIAQERAETMQKNAEVDDPAVKDLFLPDNRYRMPLDNDEDRL